MRKLTIFQEIIGSIFIKILINGSKFKRPKNFNENEVNDILGNNWFNFYKGIN